MPASRAVLPEGGFSALEEALVETLDELMSLTLSDAIVAGLTEDDLVRLVVTTPPFSGVLAKIVLRRLNSRIA